MIKGQIIGFDDLARDLRLEVELRGFEPLTPLTDRHGLRPVIGRRILALSCTNVAVS
jgi:hypothetical protein